MDDIATEFLVVGESLVDEFIDARGRCQRVPGGSAHNVAVGVSRLGGEVGILTAHAEDPDGEMLRRHLEGEGVRAVPARGLIPRTSTARVTVDAQGQPVYDLRFAWVLPETVPAPSVRGLYVTSMAPLVAPGRETVQRLLRVRRPGAVTVYDLNLRSSVRAIVREWRQSVCSTVRQSDVVKASDEDLKALWPRATWQQAATRLLAMGPSAAVITLGGSGALWVDHGRSLRMPAPRVAVHDTVGAGDSFGAALLHGLCGAGDANATTSFDGAELAFDAVAALLRRSVISGAVAVTRRGADPPSADELAHASSRHLGAAVEVGR